MVTTTFKEFSESYKTDALIPVRAEILGDLDTPVSTFLKTTSGPYRFLLESVESSGQRGRYSIIGDTPLKIFESKDGRTVLTNCQNGESENHDTNPFKVLKDILSRYSSTYQSELLFNNNGLFGYLSYDSIRYIERIPKAAEDDLQLADIHLFIPQKIVVFDNLLHKIHIICFVVGNCNRKSDYESAVATIHEITEKIRSQQIPQNERPSPIKRLEVSFASNMKTSHFEDIVVKTKQHIKRGDIFQGVMSQRLRVDTEAQAFDIYRALRVINPSPYMFYMEMGEVKLMGSSPETLVKLNAGKVYLKPIAGTRKRGANDEEDEVLIADLLADPKERAEHTMLVDLGRNDIGRIAEYGSVQVEELMTIEKYSHVIHIVSTVSGTLRQGLDEVDVFKACFPAGTVSGAPKVRAMEIIEELEPTRRGIYAGAAGYFSFDGNMDVCIAIRTIYIKNGIAYLQAGAGIVADSQPEKEYQETLNKAKGLLKAIEFAEGGFA